MKTLAQIEKIADLDSRLINAAALLEAELRPPAANTEQKIGLGDLVQQEKCFAKDGFIRDINFALGIRNAIAHLSDGGEPSTDEKTRAAEYIIRAIKLVRQRTGKTADAAALESQSANSFNEATTQAALNDIYRGRLMLAGFGAVAVFIGAVVVCVMVGDKGPAPIILAGGLVAAGMAFIGGLGNKTISQSQYYSLPGSRFDNGDHRCIYCGSRAKDGRGIYTHGQYKSNTKFHDCSRCSRQLFTS